MSQMLLVNPRRRRRASKKRRNPSKRRRRSPVARRKVTRRRRRNPIARRRVRRSRRRNPIVSARSVQGQLKTAATGAVGALALDVALAYLPLPAAISGGIIGKVAKAAGAIALGIVANKVGVSAANANRMAEGALTVQLHGIGKELLAQFAPGVALSAYVNESGLGYTGSGWNPNFDVDNPDTMAGYIGADANAGMGPYGMAMYEDESLSGY